MTNAYTFLPWIRQGFSAEISVVDDLGADGASGVPRAVIPVSFDVNGRPVGHDVEVLGPGDVIGINPRVVVKTEPRHWVTDFESNYLAYIEFYEEDFPWRFTPATAANDLELSRLRPWIFLVVLEEGEFEERPRGGGPLPTFAISDELDPDAFFPPATQSWAWAHVHVSRNSIGGAPRAMTGTDVRAVERTVEELLHANADVGSSRLLCPRKLADDRSYHAFVIPAFEIGRLAGLGMDVPPDASGLKASWGDGQRLFPIYYRWFFRTGSKGDFEYLVDLLEPRRVDKRVGVRGMDMQEPGYEVDGMTRPLAVMGLEGALQSLETEPSPAQWPPPATDFASPALGSAGHFLNQLEQKVNLQLALQQESSADDLHPDPIVSPPLYGKWYALADRLDVRAGAGWVDELNRDPRYRVPAGAGTQVIQKEQERLMQQAWAQLGDLLQANQRIRQLQLACMSAFAAYRKNVLPQPADQLLTFTHAVHGRVLGSPRTIASQVKESRVPQAVLDPAFRKIARARGAVMRKVVPEGAVRPSAVLAALNSGALSAAPPPPAPTGQISLDGAAASITRGSLPSWLVFLLRRGNAAGVLGAVLVLAVALVLGAGLLVAIGAGLAAALAWLAIRVAAARGAASAGQMAEALQEKSFTPEAVDRIAARPGFALTDFDAPMPETAATAPGDSVEARNFRIAVKDAFNVYRSPPPGRAVAAPLDIDNAVGKLKAALNPAVAIPKRAQFLLKIPASIKNAYLRPHKTLVTVMAHPVFGEPMYRALRDISVDFLAPNLELIPNNTVALLRSNQRFIEAYMVGLNDEMGRELLWREFPTDQRGSYFRQFWDVGDAVNRDPTKPAAQVEEELLDIAKLHTWDRASALGEHASRPLPSGAEAGEARLVLVIKGDLLKKYPNTVVYAQRARWAQDDDGRDVRVLDDAAQSVKEPAFKAEIDPDVRFLGFDLTASVAKGDADPAANDPGWFFVLQERPGEPRFGLDVRSDESPDVPTTWDDVAWEHLVSFEQLGCVDFAANIPRELALAAPDDQFQWGRNAADMAYILYQVPVMVAFHAADMLP